MAVFDFSGKRVRVTLENEILETMTHIEERTAELPAIEANVKTAKQESAAFEATAATVAVAGARSAILVLVATGHGPAGGGGTAASEGGTAVDVVIRPTDPERDGREAD